jgi:hypothetical protein
MSRDSQKARGDLSRGEDHMQIGEAPGIFPVLAQRFLAFRRIVM